MSQARVAPLREVVATAGESSISGCVPVARRATPSKNISLGGLYLIAKVYIYGMIKNLKTHKVWILAI